MCMFVATATVMPRLVGIQKYQAIRVLAQLSRLAFDPGVYKYLSCVPGVDGKIHPEGVVQHRR